MTWRAAAQVLIFQAVALGAFAPTPAHAQTAGGACSGSQIAALQTSGNNLYCYSNVWTYPAYQFGSTNGATCNSTEAGAIQWTGSVFQVCNGSIWTNMLYGASLGTSVPAAGSTGYVQFNTGGDLNANSNLFWDNTNLRLGIGTASPQSQFSVQAASYVASQPYIAAYNPSGQEEAALTTGIVNNTYGGSLWLGNGTGSVQLQYNEGFPQITTTTESFTVSTSAQTLGLEGSYAYLKTGTTYDIYVNARNNIGIGTATVANKLDVNGAAAIGTQYVGVYTAPTSGMIVQGNVGIGTTAPGALFTVGNNGFEINSSGQVGIGATPGTYGIIVNQGANNILLESPGVNNSVFVTGTGSGFNSFALSTSGGMLWGSGSANVDTAFFRNAAGVLAIGTGGAFPGANTNGTLVAASVGIGTTAPYVSLDLHSKTDALALPVGTQGQEPASPLNGMIRYSTTANDLEAYIAGAWTTLTTGGDNAAIYLGTSASNTNPQVSGDPTTGLFSPVGSSVAIAAAGTEIMRVNGTGVSIGTATPGSSLKVYGPASPTIQVYEPNGGTGNPTLNLFLQGGGSGNLNFDATNFNLLGGGSGTTNIAQFGTGGSTLYKGILSLGQTSDTAAEVIKSLMNGTSGGDALYLQTFSGSGGETTRMGITGSTNTANVYFVNSNVGIGTTSPGYMLDVNGGTAVPTANFQTPSTNSSGTQIQLTSNVGATARTGLLALDTGGNMVVRTGSTGSIYLDSVGAASTYFRNGAGYVVRMTINTTGVGINGTWPINALDVPAGIAIGTAYAGIITAPSNGAIIQGSVGIGTTAPAGMFTVGNNYQFTVGGTGNNVGVGTSTPANVFQVAGGGLAVGNFRSSDSGVTYWDFGRDNAVTGNFVFASQGSTKVVISTAGTVGIGTTSPANKLDVNGGAAFGAYAGVGAPSNSLIVSGNVGIGTANPASRLAVYNGMLTITNNSSNTSPIAINMTNSGTGGGTGAQINFPYGNIVGNYNYLTMTARDSTSLALGQNFAAFTSSGSTSLGLGTATPIVRFDVNGSLATNTTGTEDELHLTRQVQGGVSYPQVAAFQLGTYNTAVGTGPDTRLDINLKAAANNTLSGDTNVMTLQSSGNVGIGTTSPNVPLYVYTPTASAVVLTLQNGTGTCTFAPTTGATSFSCSSDERLKEDIVDTADALGSLDDMRVRDYTVKIDRSRMTGVIAQELLATHPEMVHMGANGYYTVDAPNPWKVVKAIQQLKAGNDNLAGSLKAANDNIAELHDEVAELQRRLGRR